MTHQAGRRIKFEEEAKKSAGYWGRKNLNPTVEE